MHVRYVTTHAYGMGGTIRTIINQANAMAAAGHDVELVSVVRRRDKPFFPVGEAVRIVDLVDERTTGHRPPRSWHLVGKLLTADRRPGRIVPADEPAYQTYTRRVESAAAAHFRQLSGGILVTSRPGLNLLAARYAPRSVVRVGQEHMHLDKHKRGVRAAIRRHYRRLDAVVTLTTADRAAYQAELAASNVRVMAIPNAVHRIHRDDAPARQPVVIAAGRLRPQKGFDLLIRAFEQVLPRAREWQLRIFGSGPMQQSLRRMIHQRHLYNSVVLMDRTSDLDAQLATASIFVLSSRFEGLPMVLIEAMAHGLPVASFDCPTGPANVITDGVDGLLVPNGDVDGLASALSRLIHDDDLREQLGRAALKRSADYVPAVITPRWEALFADLLARKNS